MKGLLVSVAAAAALVLSPAARAQHMHSVPHTSTHFDTFRHGNHFHTVPHTTTHYHNYWHNGPDYLPYTSSYRPILPSYPSYYPGYSTYSGYSAYSAYPYGLAPGIGYSAAGGLSANLNATGAILAVPQATAGAAIAANKIPAGAGVASVPAGSRRAITLVNPADNGGAITYAVNSYTYTMQPGETQTLPPDRDWTIRFDNGLGKPLTYRLTEGSYRFTVSADSGWNVQRQSDALRPAGPSPAVAF